MTSAAYRRVRFWFVFMFWFVTCFTCQQVFTQVETETRTFNVAGGPAIRTLKEAAQQAEIEFIFSAELVRDVITPPIQGNFSPLEAFDLMLEETSLTLVFHQGTGVYAITEDPDISESDSSIKPNKETEMNTKNNLIKTIATVITLGVVSGGNNANAQDTENDIFELSPFAVDASQDSGYIANNTLAGSRLNTALIDTPAAIDVLTLDLIEDIGAVNMDEALQYATNSNNDIFVADGSDNAAIEGQARRFNIRGLQATRTRNYLPITYSADTYNITRLEENRGPNSILFGIGSPAGIINANTKSAEIKNSFQRGTLMTQSAGGIRGTIDVNQEVGEKSALRFNAVYSDLDDDVAHHAYRKTEGFHLTSTILLTDRIRFTAEGELLNQKSIIALQRTPSDDVSNWLYNAPETQFIIQDTMNPTAGLGEGETLDDYGIRAASSGYVFVANEMELRATDNTFYTTGSDDIIYEENYPELWNRKTNPGGASNLRENEFYTYGVGLEISLFTHTFLELNYATNNLKTETQAFVMGDVTASADNTLGHAGELYVEGQYRRWELDQDYTSYRATLSHEEDFGKFGNYRIALMYEIDYASLERAQRRERYVDADGMGLFHPDPRNGRNNVIRRIYFDPFDPNGIDWANVYVTGPAVDGFINGATLPDGSTAYSAWRNQSGFQSSEDDYETYMLGLQARYFNDRLVFGGGIRNDTLDQRIFDQRDKETNQFYTNEFGERWYNPNEWVDNTYKGDTKTYGVVYHVLDQLRLIYNHSSNFGLPHPSKTSYPDAGAAENTEGTGYDYGIGFRLFDNKVSGRITRFKTEATNAYTPGFNLTNISEALWDAAVASNDVTGVTQAQADANFIQGTGGTYDSTVKGYEVSITANLTRNWRLNLRYSYTDGFRSNSYPEQVYWRDGGADGKFYGFEGLPFFDRPEWADLPMDPNDSGSDTMGEYIQDFKDDLAEELALDGVALAKNSPHKFSMFTRYRFSDGPLDGIFVGGGVRYISAFDLGTGEDSNGNPIQLLGNSTMFVDFLLGYDFGKFKGLSDVTVQLNITNLFDDTDYIINRRDVSTGEITRVTYPQPLQARLSTSFSF